MIFINNIYVVQLSNSNFVLTKLTTPLGLDSFSSKTNNKFTKIIYQNFLLICKYLKYF